jgi:hypothetical protein
MFMFSLALLGICLLLAGISASSNQNLPQQEHSKLPSLLDKARLSESAQLKTALGDQVWQGWGSADLPFIIWNRSYEFLFNYTGKPPAEWSLVTDDDIDGAPYFRRKANKPQNFAVQVGEVWSASMATKNTTDVFLIDTFRGMFPSPIKQVFPYRLLLQPSETQIGGLLHETFHVYQYQLAPDRIKKAESIHGLGDQYEAASDAFNGDLKKESQALAKALKAKGREEKIDLASQFLSLREVRRKNYQLSSELVDYERWVEWEEGTAKYIEVAILKKASESPDYPPLREMQKDPDFKAYQKVHQRWSQELIQLQYQTTSGESQFYLTGMAQAFLLDDLMPEWKAKYWNDNIFLEDLLHLAVTED